MVTGICTNCILYIYQYIVYNKHSIGTTTFVPVVKVHHYIVSYKGEYLESDINLGACTIGY